VIKANGFPVACPLLAPVVGHLGRLRSPPMCATRSTGGAQVCNCSTPGQAQLSPSITTFFAAPYQKRGCVDQVEGHPPEPPVLYSLAVAGVLERMANTGRFHLVGFWTVDMAGWPCRCRNISVVQGNVDSGAVVAPPRRSGPGLVDTVSRPGAGATSSNSATGIPAGTPEENCPGCSLRPAKTVNELNRSRWLSASGQGLDSPAQVAAVGQAIAQQCTRIRCGSCCCGLAGPAKLTPFLAHDPRISPCWWVICATRSPTPPRCLGQRLIHTPRPGRDPSCPSGERGGRQRFAWGAPTRPGWKQVILLLPRQHPRPRSSTFAAGSGGPTAPNNIQTKALCLQQLEDPSPAERIVAVCSKHSCSVDRLQPGSSRPPATSPPGFNEVVRWLWRPAGLRAEASFTSFPRRRHRPGSRILTLQPTPNPTRSRAGGRFGAFGARPAAVQRGRTPQSGLLPLARESRPPFGLAALSGLVESKP